MTKKISVTTKDSENIETSIVGGDKSNTVIDQTKISNVEDIEIFVEQISSKNITTDIVGGNFVDTTDVAHLKNLLGAYHSLVGKQLSKEDQDELAEVIKKLMDEYQKSDAHPSRLERLAKSLRDFVTLSKVIGQTQTQIHIIWAEIGKFFASIDFPSLH